MKKLVSLIALISVFVLMFNSCLKDDTVCVQTNMGNVYLSSTDKQIIPYKGNEKLVFSDSLGDTLLFTGGSRSSSMSEGWCDTRGTSGETCFQEYYFAEANGESFSEQKDFGSMSVYISVGCWPLFTDLIYNIGINITYQEGFTSWDFVDNDFNYNNNLKIYQTGSEWCTFSYADSLRLGLKSFTQFMY